VTRAKLYVQLKTRRMANSIARSLEPELGHPAGAKATVSMKAKARCIVLKFHARNNTALRAIMTSYLRMIGVCMRVTEEISLKDE
jgi:tRNA threonylcarbamoyladenosine modification (KEOPS) complex  Pcc1 subunit